MPVEYTAELMQACQYFIKVGSILQFQLFVVLVPCVLK